ncbi:MAG: hypothetical protein M0R03_08345 [Novosphingobium sp.]|nr:hypothetical protein [Novosphingobium sp.]
MSTKAVREIAVKWDDILLVCRKCGKKLDGGFGAKQDDRLDKVLRKEIKRGKRRVKVVPVPCLDICPKNAVTVLKGGAPGSAFLVPRGADAGDVLRAMGLAEEDTRRDTAK